MVSNSSAASISSSVMRRCPPRRDVVAGGHQRRSAASHGDSMQKGRCTFCGRGQVASSASLVLNPPTRHTTSDRAGLSERRENNHVAHDASLIASSFASSGNSAKSRSSSLNIGLTQGFFGFGETVEFFSSAFFPQLFSATNSLVIHLGVAW